MLLGIEMDYRGRTVEILWTGGNVRIMIDGEQRLSAPSGPGSFKVWLKAACRMVDLEEPGSLSCKPVTWPRPTRHPEDARDRAATNGDKGDKGCALRLAAKRGEIETVAVLLSGGADARAEDSHGWTPLMLAAMRGHTDVVRLLCERGARDHTGCEHSHYARLLHDLSPADKQQVRRWGLVRRRAAENGYAEILALLYDHCADRCADCGDSYPDGDTFLIHAILWGHFGVAKVLLDRRTEPDSPTEDKALSLRYFNQIALTLAVRGTDERIVRLLLGHGADVNGEGVYLDEETALMEAARLANVAMVKLLLAEGAAVNTVSYTGKTAVSFAQSTYSRALDEQDTAKAGRAAEVIRLLREKD